MPYIFVFSELIPDKRKPTRKTHLARWDARLDTDEWKLVRRQGVVDKTSLAHVTEIEIVSAINENEMAAALCLMNRQQYITLKDKLNDLEGEYIDEDEYRSRRRLLLKVRQLFRDWATANNCLLSGEKRKWTRTLDELAQQAVNEVGNGKFLSQEEAAKWYSVHYSYKGKAINAGTLQRYMKGKTVG